MTRGIGHAIKEEATPNTFLEKNRRAVIPSQLFGS